MNKRFAILAAPVAVAGVALIAAGCAGGAAYGSAVTSQPSAALSAVKLAVAKRPGGAREVTYAGHPLYTYAGDAKPGDTKGEGLDQFGAEWYVVSPNGRKIDND